MTRLGRAYLTPSSALGAGYDMAPVTEDVHWQTQGLCRTGAYDSNLWHPDPPAVEHKCRQAIDICHECPVMMACRNWALQNREMYGVWGGLSADDRQAIWKGRKPRRRTHRKTLEDWGISA